MFQITLTPAASKRLIAKAMILHLNISDALKSKTVVIIAGTTNGYIAQEILKSIRQDQDFNAQGFFRGITTAPNMKTTKMGRLSDESKFPGDVVIEKGVWQKGKTIFDVVNDLSEGDVILKGANALNLKTRKAGILIGHPRGGTIAASLPAMIGRRVKLIHPVTLEKRIEDEIDKVAKLLNEPGAQGPRLLPVPGDVFTEIDALKLLFDVKATLVAAGGVCGAEGSVWLAIHGKKENIEKARELLNEISKEKLFEG